MRIGSGRRRANGEQVENEDKELGGRGDRRGD
jgi:hypothetical protein